jgi:hypothetical protein
MNQLTDSAVSGISSTISSVSTNATSAALLNNAKKGVGVSMPDPIGALVKKSLTSINSISSIATDRIKKLEEDIVKSVDNTGKVQLSGNTITITLQPKDAALVPVYQAKIQKDLTSIQSTLTKMQTLIATLSVIANTANTLKAVLDVQEALLTINPVSKATLSVMKIGIKILTYKDILSDYIRILQGEVTQNAQVLQELVEAVTSLNVKFTVDNAANQGDVISQQQALNSIASSSLATSPSSKSNTETYTNQAGNTYFLKVEPYGAGELIAKAIDQFSGLTKVETAPSYIATPDQLISELKAIIGA